VGGGCQWTATAPGIAPLGSSTPASFGAESIVDPQEQAPRPAVVREAGYNPGTVLPSMIAALGVVDASRPTMVIKVEHGTTTFAIVDDGRLLLYRALENAGATVTGESLVEDVNTSLVYFEDRYKVAVERVLAASCKRTPTRWRKCRKNKPTCSFSITRDSPRERSSILVMPYAVMTNRY